MTQHIRLCRGLLQDLPGAFHCSLGTLSAPLDISIVADDCRARLCDLVPAARAISDLLCTATRRALILSEYNVPCRRGCWACCKYLVPLSIPEAVRLTEEILELPSAKRMEVLKSLISATTTIMSSDCSEDTSPSSISQWYSQLGLSCPLIEDGICTMYHLRPLACREHLMTGSPCDSRQDGRITAVDMPTSATRALAIVAAEMEGTEEEAVMLPLASAWYEGNSERAMRTWPAPLLARRFAAALSQQPIHAAAR
jgi:Fe-S-cluster containining protein